MPGAREIDWISACPLLPSQLWALDLGMPWWEGSLAEASLSLSPISSLARQSDTVALWRVRPCLGPGTGFPAWI